MKIKKHDFKVRDRVKMLGKWGHIVEVRSKDVRVKPDGLGDEAYLVYKDMLHKVPYRPDPIAKISFYWLVKARKSGKPKNTMSKKKAKPKCTVVHVKGYTRKCPAKKKK